MAKSAPISNLHAAVAAIFGETQVSVANHRKNSVALYKLHVQASKPTKDGSETREEEFEQEFMLMLTRVMELKKGALPDRVVRFAGTYVKHLNAKVVEENEKKGITPDDTLASRFTSHILNFLMGGFNAKNKVVRGRCVQIVAEMMPGIGDLDEDTFNQLRFGLSQRIRDKEASIRVSAVLAIHKLIGTEDPDDNADEETVLERLLDIMSNDDAAEVRRMAVQYIPILPDTLHYILLRLRDVDTQTRKTVYSAVLQPKLGHPRRLTIAQREEIVKSGLGDREPSVRLAASKMLTSWLDIMMSEGTHAKELEAWEGDDGGIMKGLIEFLHLFDVVGPGSVMGADGVTAIFNLRPEIVDVFKFTDEYWTSLTAESAVLARCFVAFCLKEKKQEVMDESGLPAISAFAYYIGDHYNSLLAILDELQVLGAGEEGADSEEIEQREEDLARAESILKELLQMTVNLDFSDELGRRKLFAVVRNILGHVGLREGIIEPALDVLYQITPSEQELVRIVVEIVSDLRDKDEDEDDDGDAKSDAGSVASVDQPKGALRKIKDRSTMSPEEQRTADEADLRCLTICIAMLERVNGSFEENVILEGLIADLIVPAVKSKDIVMREKGLISLGLCCLIAKKMALNSFKLFFSQLQNTPDELRLKVLTIVFDLILVYEFDIIARDEVVAEQITTFLVQMLEAEEVPKVQATLCVGICKLLLAGLIKDQKVLATLVLTYISPVTADNEELRQCLSFFFPVYCYSSLENQARMQAIFLQAFEHATELRDELEDGEEMISLQQLSTLMMDWTNQEKSVDKTHEKKQVHASLAVDLLKALYDSERTDEERKIFCQQLNHLHINKGLDLKSITKLSILTEHLHAQHPLQNATLERSMNKFRGTLGKMFEHDLQELEFNTLLDDELRGLYDYIGVDVPEGEDVSFSFERSRILTDSMIAPAPNEEEDEGTPVPAPAKKETKKGRGKKKAVTPDSDEEDPPPKKATRKSKGKKAAKESDEDEPTLEMDLSDEDRPRRATKKGRGKKKAMEEEEEEPDFEMSPMKPATKRRTRETPRGVSPLRKRMTPASRSRMSETPVSQPSRRSSRQTPKKVQTYAEPSDEEVEELDEVPEEDEDAVEEDEGEDGDQDGRGTPTPSRKISRESAGTSATAVSPASTQAVDEDDSDEEALAVENSLVLEADSEEEDED